MSITVTGGSWVEPDDEDPTIGVRITVDAEGNELSRENVTGLEPPTPTPEQRVEAVRAELDAPRAAARILIAPKLLAGELSDDEIVAVARNFELWDPDGTYFVDDIVLDAEGNPYRCIQDHPALNDVNRAPNLAVSLWTPFRQTQGSTPDQWVQPTGAQDAYNIGDRVTFEGSVYESTIDANTFSPTAYPAGWNLIS